VHVWTCEPEHCVAPCDEQLLVQTDWQLFIAAEQLWPLPHGAAADQARQLFASAWHV
jgi:hypothetical protein